MASSAAAAAASAAARRRGRERRKKNAASGGGDLPKHEAEKMYKALKRKDAAAAGCCQRMLRYHQAMSVLISMLVRLLPPQVL